MTTLRDYQQAAVDATFDWLANRKGNPLVVVPTGGGKSVILSEIIIQAYRADPDVRIMVVTHVKELIEQNHAALLRMWPGAPAGVYSAGLRRRDERAQILFCGIQSVYDKTEAIGRFNVAIVDEAHLIPANGFGRYRTLFAALTKYNPNLRVVGLTATPFRTDSGRLDTGDERIFHGLAYVCEILPLIEAGYLSRITNIAGNAEIDTSQVAIRGGEYVESELQAAAMAGDNVAQAVEETIKRAAGRKSWLLFATGIEHAKAVAEELRKRGVETATIFGNTGHHERDAIVKGFRAGLVRCVVNVGVLTTGFDAPAVDLVVLLRPTYSPGLYVQMVGRGLRTAPGKKDCLILDFGGNVLRHGPINRVNIRQPKAKGDENQEEPATVKKCPECGLVVDRDATECECGYEFARGPAEHDATPEETLPILEPKRAPIERWKVGRTFYDSHCKPGKRPVLRVTHLCGFGQEVNEWVCIEHDAGSFPRKKAERWWVERGGPLPVPDTVDVALTILSVRPLPDVVEVVVLTTGEFPEVKGAKIDREDAGWRADAEDAGKPSTDVPDDDLPF